MAFVAIMLQARVAARGCGARPSRERESTGLIYAGLNDGGREAAWSKLSDVGFGR